MKYLPMQLASFLSSGLSKAAAEESSLMDGKGASPRFDAIWDEALMASMYDSNARWLLDSWGPRGR